MLMPTAVSFLRKYLERNIINAMRMFSNEYQDGSGKVLSDADVAKYLYFPELTFYYIT